MDPSRPPQADAHHPGPVENPMSAALKTPLAPRYGSAAELAVYSGLSVKTVRRLVDAGKVRGLKVGRRLLIPFADLDRHILPIEEARPKEAPPMSIVTASTAKPSAYVPAVSAEELATSNRGLVELLNSWEAEGDEDEQRETMDVLRESLGARRVASSRKLFQ